jgi:hypothetical protein
MQADTPALRVKERKTMKVRLVGLAAVIGCAALCLALPAHGQNSITLTGVNGSYSAGDLCSQSECGQAYTGIYYSTVDTVANTPTVCDDFNHTVTMNETWNASAIETSTLNSSNIGQTEFGGTIGLVGYAEVATLVSEIFALNNGTASSFGGVSNVTGTDLSEAIWYITTPGHITGISSNAMALVTWVEGLYGSSSVAQAYLNALRLWILTPAPNNGPQEFWAPDNGSITDMIPLVTAPEGGSAFLYLLLAGLSCFGAMRFSSRNQAGRRGTA